MPARLLHIWGPLWIQSYGVMILLALIFSLPWAVKELEKKRLLSRDVFFNALSISVLLGIFGGRVMHFLFSPDEFLHNPWTFFAVWDGGLSLLGAVIAIPPFALWFIHKHGAPVFEVADVITRYIPLVQAIARFGCFFAGCCYGLPASDLPWAIMYNDPYCLAPCGVLLHPAQLYSVAASFCIFIFLFGVNRFGKIKNSGIIFGLYFFCEGIARCVVEFWRSEYAEIMPALGIFNAYQLISLAIAFAGGIFALIRFVKSGK